MPNPMVGQERLEAVVIREKLPTALKSVKVDRGETFLCVDRDQLVEVIRVLKEDERTAYDYFCECVGVDYSQWPHARDFEERFEVVYNLMSLKHYARIFIKVGVNDGQTVPTVKQLFLGAEYPEREVNDLFGVVFAGNEQSTRFLLPDDWVGYPLRKEYPLGGEDVLFAQGDRGPAVEDESAPHAGESWEGRTGSEKVSGR